MISLCRIQGCIVQLKEVSRQTGTTCTLQRGFKGHIVVFPQNVSSLVTLLPPSVEDIITSICIIFVGSSKPSSAWLRQNAKPLVVRKEKIRGALQWLMNNNPLYHNVRLNYLALNSLDDSVFLPYHVEFVPNNDAVEQSTSGYASTSTESISLPNSVDSEIPFENVVLQDVDCHAPLKDLKVAALQHFKTEGKAFIEVPHFSSVASSFASVDSHSLHMLANECHSTDGDSLPPHISSSVSALLRYTNLITAAVPGSPAYLMQLRHEIRAMMLGLGCPSFFLTINPADIYNPIV
ncbi:hypothetical protein AGABI1DRAFT_39015, partial [Agaricus bisporus var. burnettii JB137-S8]